MIERLVVRHASGTVVACPLKDGYYLIVALAPDASVALAEYRATQMRERLDAEL